MEVEPGLHWLHIYWVRGVSPKHSTYSNAVKDPPCAGWGHAFVIKGEKRSTVFCPYSLKAYTVPTNCSEIEEAGEPAEYPAEWLVEHIRDRWEVHQKRGWQSDYDVAAKVLTMLGEEVPDQVMKGGEVDERKKGGKEPAAELLKVVKLKGKRGQFLKWFLDNEMSGSVRGVMIEFDMTRSNALSYLHAINKDHGIGYELVGDTATIILPGDCTWPFDQEQEMRTLTEEEEDWLGEDEVSPEEEDDWLQ